MIKILAINDVFPHINNRTTIFFNNIISMLSERINVKVYWLITDDYGHRQKPLFSQYEYVFMSDFNNAYEVIKEIKPDAIYHLVGWHIVDYAFMIAKKKMRVPSFSFSEGYGENDHFDEIDSKRRIILEYIRQFFESKDIQGQKGLKKSRGMNFLKKLLFLIKTIKVNESWIKVISVMWNFLRSAKLKDSPGRFSEFGVDLLFAENTHQADAQVMWGLKRESIRIVGNPVFDKAFEKIKKTSEKRGKGLNILFITVNISGLQGASEWSKAKRNHMIKELTRKLSNLSNSTLTIKIHPISENYSEYKELLTEHKDVILSQIDNIVDIIEKADVVITSCTTTAGTIALVMRKPIIIWNYFQVKGDLFLKKGFALECKSSDALIESIAQVENFTNQNQKKINEFIKEEYGEGNANQKIVSELEKWFRTIKNTKS